MNRRRWRWPVNKPWKAKVLYIVLFIIAGILQVITTLLLQKLHNP